VNPMITKKNSKLHPFKKVLYLKFMNIVVKTVCG
jgi:hypothetical protein